MKKSLLILFFVPLILSAQTIYNPHQFYENPGGLFDIDSVRTIYILIFTTQTIIRYLSILFLQILNTEFQLL